MRIPLGKIWRAFPELDNYTDDECMRFVERAKREHQQSQVLWGLATIAGLLLAAVPALWVFGRVVPPLTSAIKRSLGAHRFRDIQTLMDVAMFALPALAIAGVVLLVRDRWLIRTITRKVQAAACPTCGYSLLGLVVEMGAWCAPNAVPRCACVMRA